MEKALLVTVKIRSEKEYWHIEELAFELEQLAAAGGAEVIDNITSVCERPTANFLIGSGKVEEIAALAEELEVNTLIFSHDLSGTQQRNLEEVTGKKTIDRTQLILDIFARHAKTQEGKTQVELAQLEYLMPRLVGKGIILSRLGGGIGTSGPGEKKLEVDRRRIRKRIDKLKEELRNLTLHRQLIKKQRMGRKLPSVALVGYTNAGKSTLFNALTSAGQTISGTLFTTLDPLTRRLELENGENVIISDTVGFLHNLPHHLIDAFKATLEEVLDADLLIHVLDISNPLVQEHKQAVLEVLGQLKVTEKPMVTALNKTDLIEDKENLKHKEEDFINPVFISAKNKINLEGLSKKIQDAFIQRMSNLEVLVPLSRMDLVDLFYREGKVKQIEYLQNGIKIKLFLPKHLSDKFLNNKEIEKIN